MSEEGLQGFKSRRSLGALEVDNRDRGGGGNIGREPRYFVLDSGVRGGPRASGSGVEWEKKGHKMDSHIRNRH